VEIAAFFRIYGDVFLRSVYQLAPYANSQRTLRGDQFWLPMSDLATKVIATWEKQVVFESYPAEIGIPHHSGLRLTPQVFAEDKEIQRFLALSQANRSIPKAAMRRLRAVRKLVVRALRG
jgi:hypothetical protein